MAKPVARNLRAEQARDAQGQARARLRLRGRRLSLAQDRERTAVGSLLLGLYDDAGALQHVGVCASFTEEKRRELVEFLAPYRERCAGKSSVEGLGGGGAAAAEAGSGCPAAEPLEPGQGSVVGAARPELVVEVAYDHMQGGRFRHTAQFRRWRTDKKPSDCTYAQLEVVPPQELKRFSASGR